MKKKIHCGLFVPFSKQILLIMKLTLLLISINVMNSLASVYSQKVTLDMQNVKFSEAIGEIAKQTNLDFAYSKDFVDLNKTVSISVSNTDLKSVLDRLLDGTQLTHLELNGKIYLGPKYLNTIIASAFLKQQKVTGKVTDAINGDVLAGVTVVIEGTTTGTVTDINGNYSLDISDPNAILIFSSIGYITNKVAASGQTVIDIKLTADIKTLEDVVVIGYGTMKKENILGSVSYVKGSDLTKVSSANIYTALSGRLSGLQITQTSGNAGSDATFKVRGVGSVYSGNGPLILIDGASGDPATVDANDIESVSLLKDASSAAIYGARAANGVILITTKHSKSDGLKFTVTVNKGFQMATNIPKILNSTEWANKVNETTQYKAGVQYFTGANSPDKLTYTNNWFNYIFKTAPVADVHTSVAGGTEKMKFMVNMGYYNQDGIFIGSNFKKVQLRANLDYTTDKFNFGANLSEYKSWFVNTTNGNIMLDAARTPPTIAPYDANGLPAVPTLGLTGEQIKDYTPSMDALMQDYNNTTNVIASNLYAEVKLLKGLKFKTLYNVTLRSSFDRNFNKLWTSYNSDGTVYKSNNTATLKEEGKESYTWESQNLLTYTLDLGSHHIEALVGASAEKSQSEDVWANGSGMVDNSLTSLDANTGTPTVGGGPGNSSLASQFGRLNYTFKNKYLAEFSVRHDGVSSVFYKDHRWGTFPSASVGWRVSEENFLKESTIISNLKLRASYGTLGNSNIEPFKYISTISTGKYPFGSQQSNTPASYSTGPYNLDLKWESTTDANFAIDLGLIKNKLLLTAEVFDRKTTDLLLKQNTPLTTGYASSPYINLGAVDNRGWEITLEYNNNIGKLNYGATFNMTNVKNKVTDMAGFKPQIEGAGRLEQGKAQYYYYGYKVEGIYQDTMEIKASPKKLGYKSKPGDFKYKDIDGNDTIDTRDMTDLGNAIPQFYYGGTLFLSWKGFDFSVLIQGEFNKKFYMDPAMLMDFGYTYDNSEMYKSVYDKRWKGPGDQSYYPALGSANNNMEVNDRWLQNASYLRVKSIQLGYTLPKTVTAKLHLQQLRVFMTATNLFTFTKYIGFDPEIGGSQKRNDGSTYISKIQTSGGMDIPQAKVVQMGITIGL
jgi:TonB-dependent starch-binding outer membrane protein SusC